MQLGYVRNLTYKYPSSSKLALDNISFSIEDNSYTAIVGLNGSGKSTLAKIMCALLEVQSGEVFFEKDVRVALVFQSPKEQIVCSVVSRDTAFGPQNLSLPIDEIEMRTVESLAVTGLLHKAFAKSATLSLGQTQKEAIAGIIALHPDVLVLDEAVSMLDAKSRNDIYKFLSHWVKQGHCVIHITHDKDAIKEAKDVIVVQEGKITFSGKTKSFFANKEASNFIDIKPTKKISSSKKVDSEITFAFENISFCYDKTKILDNISFALQKGTLTALTGASGSGKSTILEIAAGLLEANSGKVLCASRPALCQQNSDAALFEQFVADDVAFGPSNNGVKHKELLEVVKKSMEITNLPFEKYADRQTFFLSGGEKRRVAIAGIIALNSDVLLFDEPTAGLDGPSRIKVMNLMRELSNEGKTILFSTHRQDEADFADREISIKVGKIFFDNDENKIVDFTNKTLPTVNQVVRDGAKLLSSLRNMIESSNEDKKNQSVITKLPATLKFIIFFALFSFALVTKQIYIALFAFFVSIVYSFLAKYPFKRLISSMLKIIPLIMLFCIFQMIFFAPQENDKIYIALKYFLVTKSKLLTCALTLIHAEAAIACILSFVHTTPEYDIIDALSVFLAPLKLIKIPIRYIIIIIEIIFRFIPLLLDTATEIIKTQLIRGGLGKTKGFFNRVRAIIPLFVPLVSQTIKRSESLAEAITQRCFS